MEWPGSYLSAAAITFDVDGEAGWIGIDPANAHRPGVLSQGAYGPKVGLPLILNVLERHEVQATFFVPGVIVEQHRSRIQEVVDRGHEVAVHGYTHTAPALLDPDQDARNWIEPPRSCLALARRCKDNPVMGCQRRDAGSARGEGSEVHEPVHGRSPSISARGSKVDRTAGSVDYR